MKAADHLRLVLEVAFPGEAGHQEEQGGQEGAGELPQCGGCIAQVLLAAVVPKSIGVCPVGGVAQQRALGPWEAAFALDDLTPFCGTKWVLRQGQEGGKGHGQQET